TAREHLVGDERFATRENPNLHRAALTVEIEAGLAERSAVEWEAVLNQLGIPAGRVWPVPEQLDNPQVKQRNLFQQFELPGLDRPVTLTRAGFKMLGADPNVAS